MRVINGEFNQGIYNALRIKGSSVDPNIYFRSYYYSNDVVSVMTGGNHGEAGAVALIERLINGIWFYLLHSTWKKMID